MQTVADRRCAWRDIDNAQQNIVLLCEDQQWLREQFEAIIAAEWPPRPPRLRTADAAGASRRHPGNANARAAQPHRVHAPGTDGWARQRSPPTVTRGPITIYVSSSGRQEGR